MLIAVSLMYINLVRVSLKETGRAKSFLIPFVLVFFLLLVGNGWGDPITGVIGGASNQGIKGVLTQGVEITGITGAISTAFIDPVRDVGTGYWYVYLDINGIYRNTNEGSSSFTQWTPNNTCGFTASGDNCRSLFITTANTFLGGSKDTSNTSTAIGRSLTKGLTWTPTQNFFSGTLCVKCFAQSETTGRIWFGTTSNLIYSDNDGVSWTIIDPANSSNINNITTHGNIVIVSVSNMTSTVGLLVSLDNGVTWITIAQSFFTSCCTDVTRTGKAVWLDELWFILLNDINGKSFLYKSSSPTVSWALVNEFIPTIINVITQGQMYGEHTDEGSFLYLISSKTITDVFSITFESFDIYNATPTWVTLINGVQAHNTWSTLFTLRFPAKGRNFKIWVNMRDSSPILDKTFYIQ